MTYECPFSIYIDGQEKMPWRFSGIRASSRQGGQIQAVHSVYAHLKTGDYTIAGLESEVVIERKSLTDLYGSCGKRGRDRFKAEHERMTAFPFAAVVIEADWSTILTQPPEQSRVKPASILRTAVAWQYKFGIPWLTFSDRRLAEIAVFRLFEAIWKRKTTEDGAHPEFDADRLPALYQPVRQPSPWRSCSAGPGRNFAG